MYTFTVEVTEKPNSQHLYSAVAEYWPGDKARGFREFGIADTPVGAAKSALADAFDQLSRGGQKELTETVASLSGEQLQAIYEMAESEIPVDVLEIRKVANTPDSLVVEVRINSGGHWLPRKRFDIDGQEV